MLLFLHGFLGCKEDWNPVLEHLGKGMAIDLPLYEMNIAEAILKRVGPIETLIGYSAGGRIALEMKAQFPEAIGSVIAISAHPGLTDEEERQQRWKCDQIWINSLQKESFSTFLEKWYDQPIFQSLKSSEAFHSMLDRRKRGDPKGWAQFLRHHSLGKKPAPRPFSSTIYIYGSEDLKYAALYRKLRSFQVKNCGHAVHLEQPKVCAGILEELIHDNN